MGVVLLCLSLLWLAGCSTGTVPPKVPEMPSTPEASAEGVSGFLGGLADKALESVGLKKPALPEVPEVPDSALPDWRVKWRVFASPSLNVSTDGAPLSVVMRFYKLKSPDAFLRAPMDAFGDATKEKAALGEDILGVREVQLLPGQAHEALDKVARDARFVGVVTLFRSPAPGRWRYAFSAPSTQLHGVSIGVHACAMSVQVGEPIGQPLSAVRSTALSCP